MRSRWALRWASTSLSQLADGMTYYSCPDLFVGRIVNPPYIMVDPGGFEPPTFSMPLRRAPNCAMGPDCQDTRAPAARMARQVDLEGFEPSTFAVRLRRSPN